jgi:hypothetical protein
MKKVLKASVVKPYWRGRTRIKLFLMAGTAFLALAASAPTAQAQRVNFTYTGKLITWTVPETGNYQIIAFGAQGGSVTSGNVTGPGGLGAEIGGDFSLTAGEVLQIAVGGVGLPGSSGGGGGSFVVGSGNAPLVIAGGGGGGGLLFPPARPVITADPGGGGLTGPDGGAIVVCVYPPPMPTGKDGNGGPSPGCLSAPGGGGGGFLSAGGNSKTGATGGGGFPDLSGGTPGGGFGGGGGGPGGGGGGYSGGSAGGVHTVGEPYPGGGGGSFGGGSFNVGTDQIMVAGIQTGDGEVVITKVAPVFAGTPGKANCHGKSVSALDKQYGGVNAAAAALGFASIKALQDAIEEFCEA